MLTPQVERAVYMPLQEKQLPINRASPLHNWSKLHSALGLHLLSHLSPIYFEFSRFSGGSKL